jgi:hypothetical protein
MKVKGDWRKEIWWGEAPEEPTIKAERLAMTHRSGLLRS